MTLDKLKPNQSAYILSVGGDGALRHHLLDMGLTPKTEITLQKAAPMGDPIQISLRGYELTLRLDEAKKIEINQIHEKNNDKEKRVIKGKVKNIHLYLEEFESEKDNLVHKKRIETFNNQNLAFALAGNQNCGKTTLFNQLTGSNQHVGNFPGVTVDRKDGVIRNHTETIVTDLPGIYSLSPYSREEIVTRDFLLNSMLDGIINIVDASNLERNLCLTMQLMELDIPMVLALNMMDEVRANGGSIDVNALENALGIPVVPISAAKNEGIEELISHAIHVAKYKEIPKSINFYLYSDNKTNSIGSVHRCVHSAINLLQPQAKEVNLPVRFAITKLIENDHLIEKKMNLSEDKKTAFNQLVAIMEKETGLDREAAIADMRFSFIQQLCEATVVKPHESKEHKRSVEIDKILTGKYTAIPCFLGIMAFIFVMTFNFVGAWLSNLMNHCVDFIVGLLDNALNYLAVNEVVHRLVIDGICGGVGSVISFLPTIVTLFFFLSILEDTGYMARVAFVMDKILRKIGLSGRSIVPMLIGFGCSVPAIMSTRTLSSERDRKMTILLTPFMSCSAKLPIYTLIVSTFYPQKYQALAMIGIYIFGILCGIAYALILGRTKFKGKPIPFVMELPNYRFPALENVLQLISEKAKEFIQKAFSVIFIASIAIWFLQTFDIRLNVAKSANQSLLAMIGNLLVPIFKPLGIGDWRISTALITGLTAKESVVSTLTVLLGGKTKNIVALLTPFTATIFLVFTLLYTPCVAAIATVKREMGSTRAAVLIMLAQCFIAWVIAFGIRLIGLIFGLS